MGDGNSTEVTVPATQEPPVHVGVLPEQTVPSTQCPVESHVSGVLAEQPTSPLLHSAQSLCAASHIPGGQVVTVSHPVEVELQVCRTSPLH